MKIAGLLPLRLDPEKDNLHTVSRQLERVCDEVIILHDNPSVLCGPPRVDIRLSEEIVIHDGSWDCKWNDWANRLILLVRAGKHDYRWVLWLDADEELGKTFTREHVHEICEQADAQGHVAIMAKVKTAWTETHWRKDGIFSNQMKTLLQVNPLMLKNPNFEYSPERKLHGFPRLEGPKMFLPETDFLIHWGLRSRSLREKNVAKYKLADPNGEFTEVPYDYVLNDAGAMLEPL